jgi:hypothetical protein
MIRVAGLAFCAIIFSLVLTHEASALRRGAGVHAGNLRGASFRGVYRGGLRGYHGYRAAAWGGRRYWRGGGRSYGYAGRRYWRYGVGTAALGAAGMTANPHAPGTCGAYFYWKDGRCMDARLK